MLHPVQLGPGADGGGQRRCRRGRPAFAQDQVQQQVEGTFEHRCADGVTHGRQPKSRSRPQSPCVISPSTTRLSSTVTGRPARYKFTGTPELVVHRSPDDPSLQVHRVGARTSSGFTHRPVHHRRPAPRDLLRHPAHRRPPPSKPPGCGAQLGPGPHDATAPASSTCTPTVPKAPARSVRSAWKMARTLRPCLDPDVCAVRAEPRLRSTPSWPGSSVRDRHGRAQPHDPVQGTSPARQGGKRRPGVGRALPLPGAAGRRHPPSTTPTGSPSARTSVAHRADLRRRRALQRPLRRDLRAAQGPPSPSRSRVMDLQGADR